MLVVPRYKRVILNLRNPDRVLEAIPTAKQIEYNGAKLVVVPHKPDEVKVMRNLGFNAPSPMGIYYTWPGRFKPFEAQRATSEFLADARRGYCNNGMGTGKTLAALWAYDYLRSEGIAHRALVWAPLSTLERTWADEVFFNFPHLTAAVLHGTAKQRLRVLAEPADVYIINHDGLKVAGMVEALAKRPDIDLIIPDELASARNAGTDRWRALNKVCNQQSPRMVWGLTGTPIPNGPTDAHAQCRIVTPHTVTPYFRKFRDMVMRQVGPYKWVPKDDAIETVHKVMAPAIRFALEDCVDLPEQMFEERHVTMSPEQDKAYTEMMRTLATEYEGGQITAANDAVKANKLLQIACGVAYGDEGTVMLPSGDRLDVVLEVIEQAGAKVIVFVPFTEALEHVAAKIRERWSVDIVHGETPKHERDRIFGDFKHGTGAKVLVANAGTMAHGLSLTAANVIVWYAPTNSNEIYTQACARVQRPGQTRTTLIVHIAGSPIERKMYERLRDKQTTQGVLLGLIRGDKDAGT